MATYTYSPSLSTAHPDCYRWNLVQRIKAEVSTTVTSVSDIGEETWIEFSTTLTQTQKTALDAIMASADPCGPPATGNVVVTVKDLWGGEDGANFEAYKIACGLPNMRLFYEESDPVNKPGITDLIVLWNPTALTNTQKNTLKNEFAKLITVK